jgi:3-oxoacyl-[acyl-carrier protein] reductase
MAAAGNGRAVLVTGASRGIGAAVARAFAQTGDRVAVHYGASRDRAEELAASLPGGGHVVVQADLADPEAVRRMVDGAADGLGGLEVLVNNAGIFEAHPIADTSYEQWQRAWERTLAVNLTGAANVTWCAVQHMLAGGGGTIVNVSSRGAFDRLRAIAGSGARAAWHHRHRGRARLHRDRHGEGGTERGVGRGTARREPAQPGGHP